MAEVVVSATASESAKAVPPVEDEPPAEVDLLTETDLYKILGVRRAASDEEIKKAYKKKSLKHHPDKNRGDPDAKPKFQKIAEAFAVLSDKKKRLQYDKSGAMDLEDIDIDQFMNMWVGEMMEEGGMVDEMMKEVLPWTDDDDKMLQFMEANATKSGKKWTCGVCKKSLSSRGLMLAHFEKTHKFECDAWGKEQMDAMKASFESFMKQVTGIGDSSGEFILPDGTKAEMSNVKGVPDIRGHFQSRIDKGLAQEKVLEMYRKVSPEDSTFVPEVAELVQVLEIKESLAAELQKDKKRLLKRLKTKIDSFHDEEEDELAMFEAMNGMGGLGPEDMDLFGKGGFPGMGGKGGFPGMGGKGGFPGMGGKGGFPGLGGKGGMPSMGDLREFEAMLSSMGMNDPESLAAMMDNPEAMLGMLGGAGMAGGMLGGRGGFGGDLGPRPDPPKPNPAIAQLSKMSTGDRVRVIADRSFDKFKGGMVGSITKNNAEDRNMLIQFDNTAYSGPDPVQVAYKHLEMA